MNQILNLLFNCRRSRRWQSKALQVDAAPPEDDDETSKDEGDVKGILNGNWDVVRGGWVGGSVANCEAASQLPLL